jgi:hypothetical protein
MAHETERARPRGDAVTGSRNAAMLGGFRIPITADPESNQEKTASVGPSAEAVAEAEEFLLDEIFRDLDLIRSYTTSAMEAARRGDREELRLRLRVQLRDCFRHAVELHKLLPPGRKIAAEAGRAAA